MKSRVDNCAGIFCTYQHFFRRKKYKATIVRSRRASILYLLCMYVMCNPICSCFQCHVTTHSGMHVHLNLLGNAVVHHVIGRWLI